MTKDREGADDEIEMEIEIETERGRLSHILTGINHDRSQTQVPIPTRQRSSKGML
jgi:hypothetical protein